MSRWAIILLLGTACICSSCKRSGEIRIAAPDFRLGTARHTRFYLNQQRGKVVALVFWQTTCTPCKKELVALNELYGRQKDRGLVVAAVCTDPANRDAAGRIIEGLNLDCYVLFDEGGTVGAEYNVNAYPTTVLIDRRGRIVRTVVGYTEGVGRQLHTRIAHLLAENTSQ